MSWAEEKFISLDTDLHFNIFFGTFAWCSWPGSDLKDSDLTSGNLTMVLGNLQIFPTLPENTTTVNVTKVHPIPYKNMDQLLTHLESITYSLNPCKIEPASCLSAIFVAIARLLSFSYCT